VQVTWIKHPSPATPIISDNAFFDNPLAGQIAPIIDKKMQNQCICCGLGYNVHLPMNTAQEILKLSDEQLLAGCDIHIYKASGPGGQHRNKVSSAVRLRHRETGISATANDSRSQQTNRTQAMRRLRMNIATKLRAPIDLQASAIPSILAECIFAPKKPNPASEASSRLEIGRKDSRFWEVAAILLDMLSSAEGQLGVVARKLKISTGNLTKILKSDRHLLAATQEIRKSWDLKGIS
jgi:hypothetical protein